MSPTTIDQQFVEYVVKSLVSKPDEVKVDRRVDEKGVLLELTVDPEDLGRVIGKRGATAQSLRTLLRALGTKNDARYNLKIIDNGEPRPDRPRYDDVPPVDTSRTDDNQSSNDAPDEPDVPVVADEPEEAPKEEISEHNHSDVLSKTRKELEDLDDLDI